jgi:hypothetical protein
MECTWHGCPYGFRRPFPPLASDSPSGPRTRSRGCPLYARRASTVTRRHRPKLIGMSRSSFVRSFTLCWRLPSLPDALRTVDLLRQIHYVVAIQILPQCAQILQSLLQAVIDVIFHAAPRVIIVPTSPWTAISCLENHAGQRKFSINQRSPPCCSIAVRSAHRPSGETANPSVAALFTTASRSDCRVVKR